MFSLRPQNVALITYYEEKKTETTLNLSCFDKISKNISNRTLNFISK